MSRFFVGDDFSGVEVLDDRWWPDAMRLAFPNGGVVDAHDVPRSQPGKFVDRASYRKRRFVVGPYH